MAAAELASTVAPDDKPSIGELFTYASESSVIVRHRSFDDLSVVGELSLALTGLIRVV